MAGTYRLPPNKFKCGYAGASSSLLKDNFSKAPPRIFSLSDCGEHVLRSSRQCLRLKG